MLIGATPEGKKELVGFVDGAREIILGVKFKDGIEVAAKSATEPKTAAA